MEADRERETEGQRYRGAGGQRDRGAERDRDAARSAARAQPAFERSSRPASGGDVDWNQAHRDALASKGLVRAADAEHADIFIVANLASPPVEWQRAAQLFGGRITTAAFLAPAQPGRRLVPAASVKYAPAPLCCKLYLFLSAAFRAARPHSAKFIEAACKREGSQWQCVADRNIWDNVRRSKPATSVSIHTSEELQALPSILAGSMSCSAFFDKYAYASPSHSCDGMSARMQEA